MLVSCWRIQYVQVELLIALVCLTNLSYKMYVAVKIFFLYFLFPSIKTVISTGLKKLY